MAESNQPSRRQRVEPGIYTRTDATGRQAFEIGFRDAQGKQRWRRVKAGSRRRDGRSRTRTPPAAAASESPQTRG